MNYKLSDALLRLPGYKELPHCFCKLESLCGRMGRADRFTRGFCRHPLQSKRVHCVQSTESIEEALEHTHTHRLTHTHTHTHSRTYSHTPNRINFRLISPPPPKKKGSSKHCEDLCHHFLIKKACFYTIARPLSFTVDRSLGGSF